jgi:sirohydrochlorin ferrochelatase
VQPAVDTTRLPVIGLAHGSRHPDVTASITSLMAAVSRFGQMPAVGAFLDLTDPDLTEVATRLAQQGHTQAVVVPLLFTEAFHATIDAPQAVRDAAAASGLDLTIADILGTGDDMADVVRLGLRVAAIADTESIVLLSVGSSSEQANEAITDLARRLAVDRAGEVAAAFGTRAPRTGEVLAGLPRPAAIVPLFVSPGLLLDPIARLADAEGVRMAPPLGDLVAPIVVSRYNAAARTC